MDWLRCLHKRTCFVLATLLLACVSSPLTAISNATANSTSTSMSISTNVAPSCKLLQVNTLAFGSYEFSGVNKNNPLNAASTFQISCTKNTTATIKMDAGQHSAQASGTTRALYNNVQNDYLNYELYTNPGRTTVWNQTTGIVSYLANTSAPATLNVYGSIPQNQNQAKGGSYTDTITITASF